MRGGESALEVTHATSERMSHEVIAIDDNIEDVPRRDDSLACSRCTFHNTGNPLVCAVCSLPLDNHQQRQQQQQQQRPANGVCGACTFDNGEGATVCLICNMPLVDDVEEEKGDPGQEFEGTTTASTLCRSGLAPWSHEFV